METKTLAYLNSKAWYRFLKVVYVLLIIIFSAMTIAVIFGELGSYQEDYTVTCNYGSKSTFLANKDKHIWNIPSYYDYGDSLAKLPEDTKTEIKSACGISDSELKAKVEATLNGTSDGKKLFELTKTKVYLNTKTSATLWSVLFIFIILIIFEIIRRVFYYIVLGKFRPS